MSGLDVNIFVNVFSLKLIDMQIYNKTILLLLMLFLWARVTALTHEITTVEELMVTVHELSDGDTLLIKSGTYVVTQEHAPDGLYVAALDFTPYKDVTILGEGQTQTIIDFDNSYGFLASYCDNLMFKDLTIRNATINGGIYVFHGSISVDNVVIEGCKSLVNSGYKDVGNGGAICVDEASTIRKITRSIFRNNYAQDNGGALALEGQGRDFSVNPVIDQCQFYNNTSGDKGGALYVKYLRRVMTINRSVFFNNISSGAALYLNGASNVNFKNNTVVNNPSNGLALGASLVERFYFDNNVVINNDGIDCVGNSSANNRFRGWYNVVGSSHQVAYDGLFNDIVSTTRPLFKVSNDHLNFTIYGAGLLAGRVSGDRKMTSDIDGNVWSGVGDVGAMKVPLGDSISVWQGSNSDFSDASNWKGILPGVSTQKVVISHCLTSDYPIIDKGNVVNIPSADVYIAATGALKLVGDMTTDTLYLESQNGGTAQFLNKGKLIAEARLSELFLENDLCSPVYFPDSVTIVSSVLPHAVYDDDFCARAFNESDLSYIDMLATDTFFQDQGYWMQSFKNQTMSFSLPEQAKESFELKHSEHVLASEEGWNVIGNPYGAPLLSERMMDNLGNASKVASAVYSFSDGHFKAYVDSVGDVEAKVVMPYKAFYLKALSGSGGASFKVDTGDVAIMSSEDILDVDLKPEMMRVRLYDQRNDLIDKTYIRINNNTSDGFDNASDAYKLDCMFGLGSESLYSMIPSKTDVYAINTFPLQVNDIKSIDLSIMVQPSAITSSPSRMLAFDLSDGAEVEYLLHDSEQDSSESKIIKDGAVYRFKTGRDSAALSHRFSLQLFEDTVPYGVLGVTDIFAQGYFLAERNKSGSKESTEVESTMLESIALLDNPDTIFYEQLWVDTVYYDSISYQINYYDSTVVDSIISDTLRVLGTYEYVVREVNTTNTRYTTTDTVYLDTVFALLRTNEYVLYDTALVASNKELEAQNLVEVTSLNGALLIQLPNQEKMVFELYNLSGEMLRNKEIQYQGRFSDLIPGIYILNMNGAGGHWSSKVLVK